MSLIKCASLLVIVLSVLTANPQLSRHVIALHGNTTFGYYYANIFVGSPPQEQSVIIDTGSGILALPCSKCLSCGKEHIQPPFDITRSKSNKIMTCEQEHELCQTSCKNKKNANPCTFLISYAQGSSLSGLIIEDDVQFERDGEGQSVRVAFGCTTKQTNLFYTQAANGIFGLAPKRKSRLFQQLYQKHHPFTDEQLLFSICLANNGGELIVGRSRNYQAVSIPKVRVAEQKASIDNISSKKNPDIKTRYSSSRNQYSLENVGYISVNGTKIRTSQSLGYYGMFLDTGSTFTYFPRKFYQSLVLQLQNSCAYQPQKCRLAQGSKSACFRIETSQKKTIKQSLKYIFAPIQFQINGAVVSWQPQEYFLLRSIRNKQICLGIDPLDRFLLGSNWMINREVVFRLDRSEIEIYNNASCGSGVENQELGLYTGASQNESPLEYIEAVVRSHEDTIAQFLIIVLVLILLLLGAIVVSRFIFKNVKKVPRKKGHKLPQQQIPKEHQFQNQEDKEKAHFSQNRSGEQDQKEQGNPDTKIEQKSQIILITDKN